MTKRPQDFGLPSNAKDEDRVPKLEKRTWASSVGVPTEVVNRAWQAYDVTLVVTDKDFFAADRAYQAVIKQWRQHGKINT